MRCDLKAVLARYLSIILIVVTVFSCGAVLVPAYADDVNYHETEKEASAELREAMKARMETVTIGLIGETDQKGLKNTIGNLIDEATAHTGKPTEGDYIKFQYISYKGYAQTAYHEGNPVIEVEYTISYYDSAEQEAEVDEAIGEIMEELDLEEKTEYEKILAIHNYLCDNVKYDDAEETEGISHTAYGALINGEAVCQGYATALYRLLLEAGIDNRIVYGNGVSQDGEEGAHAWNVVELEGDYYYIDVIWDDSTWSKDYFLQPKGSDFETSHIADEEYSTDDFTEEYTVTDQEYTGEFGIMLAKVKRALGSFIETICKGISKLLANH